MRLSVELDGTVRRVDLTSHTEAATLADLLEQALGHRPGPEALVWVDDRQHPVTERLGNVLLLEGSTLSASPRPVPMPLPGWAVTEICLEGVHGTSILTPGTIATLGRAPMSTIRIHSAAASWAHADAKVDEDTLLVRDLGSTNGTRVDGQELTDEGTTVRDDATMRIGSSILQIRKDLGEPAAPRPGSLHNVTPAGTVPFNRPPRPSSPEAPEKVKPPTKQTVSKRAPFSLAMVIGPIIMAGGMMIMMGDLRYAMISALSPILAVFTWFEQRRRHRKETRESDEKYAKDIETLKEDILTQGARERALRSWVSPDVDLVRRRAAVPATTLWQRRAKEPEFLVLSAGIGDVPWKPEVDTLSSGRLEGEVEKIVEAALVKDAPVQVDLTDAGVIGIVGTHEATTALARSLLLQAAVHCGPADLTIGVFHDKGREPMWDWATWLPHTRMANGEASSRWYCGERKASEQMLRSMRDSIEGSPTPATLLVIDSDVLLEGRDAPARELIGHGRSARTDSDRLPRRVSAIVLAQSTQALPAACSAVIEIGQNSSATLHWPGRRSRVESFTPMGLGVEHARESAKDLARFEDPELSIAGAGLPSLVRMNPLLGLEKVDAEEILGLWSSKGVSAPVGIGSNGAYSLDLVRDGPHGLVGGTTGSGKSEFLRTLVAGLAARNSPEKLTFILIDFKGGAAFKTCERLPHTIGTVSNLDAQLADRALRALEAEMNYRQRLFASAGEGVDNLDAYLATDPPEPLPRLLLVVDEFAMLAKEYPDVLSSLVSVAAVGRTLGVHMILATQRPAGVVNEDILANTNLRVALRVQSREDSASVIGVPDAAAISRIQRGRAYVKLGQDDITAVQTALVTGVVESEVTQPVTMTGGVGVPHMAPKPVQRADEAETDLDVLIDAIVAANDKAGVAAPRPVWPEALGERVHLSGFPRPPEEGEDSRVPEVGAFDGSRLHFAISDDPDRQRQIPAGWAVEEGNLLVAGTPGYGTTTTLASIALAAAVNQSPEDLDLLILDMGSNELRPLAQLPQCVGYTGTGPGDNEKRVRLVKYLRSELDARRADPSRRRRMIVLVDGLASLRDEYNDSEGMELLDLFYRAYQDGPDVGIHFAVATSRVKVVPSQVAEVTEQKMLFQLADRYDYAFGGLRPEQAPSPVPGRTVVCLTKLQTHVATPGCPMEEAVAWVRDHVWAGVEAKADVIGSLPSNMVLADLPARAQVGADLWRLPIGVAEADLGPAWLESYEGEHILIAGPPRCGKSTGLLTLAQAVRSCEGEDGAGRPLVWAVCNRRSPLAGADLDRVVTDEADVPALLAALLLQTEPVLLLVDDAERIADSDGSLGNLVSAAPANVRVAAAGRNDDIRGLYSHWTKTLRRSRCGVVLQPNIDMDSDLLSARIPRRSPVAMTVGRGYLCLNGSAHLLQMAVPSDRTQWPPSGAANSGGRA
ncbi:FHA domain-containing protein [Schaalia sp. 19OD2882]|uniref:FtsK/SpoIIIE domain-containing protein n=1 Tax=Schaalia sp. 19OD2882 TaxID=2794089 RepID=UPI001C1EA77B|nr:FtsK/SpoIIIE domain-containing protein [Schaalia sp. 19OD2882]QWW19525.1 FHA domain-containing protein [Schaalia sp. 19OD2882]